MKPIWLRKRKALCRRYSDHKIKFVASLLHNVLPRQSTVLFSHRFRVDWRRLVEVETRLRWSGMAQVGQVISDENVETSLVLLKIMAPKRRLLMTHAMQSAHDARTAKKPTLAMQRRRDKTPAIDITSPKKVKCLVLLAFVLFTDFRFSAFFWRVPMFDVENAQLSNNQIKLAELLFHCFVHSHPTDFVSSYNCFCCLIVVKVSPPR